VGTQRIIERERRWALAAAFAALLPLVLYIASVLIEQGASVYSGASEAQQLRSLHDHSGTVVLSSIIRAAGFVALPVPLLYLFRAAQARNPRVQTALVAFAFIGPLLFAAQGVLQATAASQVSSDFVKQGPEEPSQTYSAFQSQVKKDPNSIDKVTIYTGPNALEIQQTNGTFYTVGKYPASAESGLTGDLDAANVDNETDTDAASRPGDAFASHLTDNSGTIQVAQALLFPGVLGLVVAMIYISLQALRTGLLTRFVGSLGIALGASMILILPLALLGMVVWIGYLGLLFVGRVPGGRPPAWETGEAMPWPKPGAEPPAAPGAGGEAIEGDATEIPAGAQPSSTSEGGAAPSQKRKRKQRR
jgi:hypothetical protein